MSFATILYVTKFRGLENGVKWQGLENNIRRCVDGF